MDTIDSSYVAAGTQASSQVRMTTVPRSVSAETPTPPAKRAVLPAEHPAPHVSPGPRTGSDETNGQGAAQQVHRELRFTVREHSDRIMITVMNADNDEVIRQIPLEETVRAGELLSRLRGLLLDTVA